MERIFGEEFLGNYLVEINKEFKSLEVRGMLIALDIDFWNSSLVYCFRIYGKQRSLILTNLQDFFHQFTKPFQEFELLQNGTWQLFDQKPFFKTNQSYLLCPQWIIL